MDSKPNLNEGQKKSSGTTRSPSKDVKKSEDQGIDKSKGTVRKYNFTSSSHC